MKNLFLSVIAIFAVFALYTSSYATLQDDPKNMKDCSCSTCEMKSDCNGSCSGDMSTCSMKMSEFKKEPMKMSSGERMSSDSIEATSETTMETMESMEPMETTSAGVCPVSGEALGDDAITYTYLGKEYKFCCEGCVGKFKNEPMEYSEGLQCPVMGGAANKENSVVYEGTKYYFCCDGCDDKFMENPEKYMNGKTSEE